MRGAAKRCCWLPVSVLILLAQPSHSQVLRLTEPQEIELGRRAAAEIEFHQPLLEDSEISDYVERLGLRLARKSGRPHLRYRFRVLNAEEVNAFALPGGFIYVTRGLLDLAESESELAGALAHEIAHVAARHHASRIRRNQLVSLGFSVAGPAIGGGLKMVGVRRAGQSTVQGLFQRFSRDDEREADRLAAKNLYRAGYDPRGLLTLLERLRALEERQPSRVQRFFASHPSLEERTDNIADLLESFEERESLVADRPGFKRVKQRLASLKPPAAGSTTEAAMAILEAAEDAPVSREARHREVASLYAPLFYQALGEHPRYDYITNFDFDGDWRGDNNWKNAGDRRFPLEAWVYYDVRETPSHYFLFYAVFHPRDYKGGKRRGRLLSRVIRAGVERASSVDPTGRAQEAVLAHENDLEGCLIVVEKQGPDPRRGQVRFVETLAHNEFLRYVPETNPLEGVETVPLSGRRAKLYIEPRGHGIEAWRGDEPQRRSARKGFRLYVFTGQAEAQGDDNRSDVVGYDLAPIATTLWPRALAGISPTYGETEDYGLLLLDVFEHGAAGERAIRLGRLGSAFRGTVGGRNLARPPWGWFDGKNPTEPLGHWYFDPARTIRTHFRLGRDFPVAYLPEDVEVFAASVAATTDGGP